MNAGLKALIEQHQQKAWNNFAKLEETSNLRSEIFGIAGQQLRDVNKNEDNILFIAQEVSKQMAWESKDLASSYAVIINFTDGKVEITSKFKTLTVQNKDLDSNLVYSLGKVFVHCHWAMDEKYEQLISKAAQDAEEKRAEEERARQKQAKQEAAKELALRSSIDNYIEQEPDRVEVLQILVREWTEWKNSEQKASELYSEQWKKANSIYASEIRNIFGCTSTVEDAKQSVRLRNANSVALNLYHNAKKRSLHSAKVTCDLHVDGDDGLHIKAGSVSFKIPSIAVDADLINAVAELFPDCMWFASGIGGYETGYRFMN